MNKKKRNKAREGQEAVAQPRYGWFTNQPVLDAIETVGGVSELAKAAGVALGTAQRVRDGKNVSVLTLEKLATAGGFHPCACFGCEQAHLSRQQKAES